MFFGLIIWSLLFYSNCVLKSKFKTCEQSGFCDRSFKHALIDDRYELDQLVCKNSQIAALIRDKEFSSEIIFTISAAEQNRLRIHATERNSIFPRFDVFKDGWSDFQSPPNNDMKATIFQINSTMCKLIFPSGYSVTACFQPLKIIIFDPKNISLVTINDKNSLYIEPHLKKLAKENEEHEDMSEHFDGHQDTVPRGHQAVSFDATFHNFQHIYGIPEHADTFSLKTSNKFYRLYNLDVFEYELYNEMALYGSIPFAIAKNLEQTLGLLFLNAAEMWVNINKESSNVFSILGIGGASRPGINTRWVAESGNIDITFMLGPQPSDVLYQYGLTTGFPPLPPLFSLGYHQSRWNYENEDDVKNVDQGFDDHNIPCDVIWLDIYYSPNCQYFLFDENKFPDPKRLIDVLAKKGRKLVNVVDPHIRKNEAYYVYNEAVKHNIETKRHNGESYVGWCWPGLNYLYKGDSIYPDFIRKEVRDWYSLLFDVSKYAGTSKDLHTWIDMNEPSVFNGPEVTAPKDLKHGQWEHRDIHNLYGFMASSATYNGGIVRGENKIRPFLLSRSFFAGSQKFGALWTGDNLASWDHLQISIPMLLSLNIAGYSFSGADVGGFFGNPDPELFYRWYQAASMQPFFRGHSHIETNRREPWSFDAETTNFVRKQIERRYRFLPYFYTVFRESSEKGSPVMRPLWYEFPDDSRTLDIENSYILGSALLIFPITESQVTSINVYFPVSKYPTFWIGLFDGKKYTSGEKRVVMKSESDLPIFQRSGSIIPTWERIRRASSKMINDPITLTVVIDDQNRAKGSFYIDDTETFAYKNGNYSNFIFDFSNGILSGGFFCVINIRKVGVFTTEIWLERVIVYGYHRIPKKALVASLEKTSESDIIKFENHFIIRKPGVKLQDGFIIKLIN